MCAHINTITWILYIRTYRLLNPGSSGPLFPSPWHDVKNGSEKKRKLQFFQMKRLLRKYEEDMKEFFRSEAKTRRFWSVGWTWTWGVIFCRKMGTQTLVVEALICMVQDNYLGVEYIRYIVYIYICMYVLCRKSLLVSWFQVANLQRFSKRTKRSRSSWSCRWAAQSCASHGWKTYVDVTGSRLGAVVGDRGFQEQKKAERRC